MNRIVHIAFAAAAAAFTLVACGPAEDITPEEAEIIMSESQGLSGACDAQMVAEYCFGVGWAGDLAYGGQCIGQNELLPGACILVDAHFGPCQYEGEFCSHIPGL